MDLEAEPGTPSTIAEGVTLTMALPLRGSIQVRVQEVTPRRITLVTLRGHPLAGAVRFLAEPRGQGVRFEVQVYDRSGNVADWLMMRTVGSQVQNATWRRLVDRVVEASGGEAPDGVQYERDTLDDDQAGEIEAWLTELVQARQRQSRLALDAPEHAQHEARPAAASPHDER
jgi:NADH dehydrogenase